MSTDANFSDDINPWSACLPGRNRAVISAPKQLAVQGWTVPTEQSRGRAARSGWWLIVDLPDDVGASHQYVFGDDLVYTNVFSLPRSVVSEYQPFRYERMDEGTA